MAAYQYPSSNLTFAQTVTKVAGDNKLANPNSISPGQTITLPDGSSVVVQRGDTLSGIVDKWKTNAEAQANATPPAPPKTVRLQFSRRICISSKSSRVTFAPCRVSRQSPPAPLAPAGSAVRRRSLPPAPARARTIAP